MPIVEKPLITVITASWDREKYLKKLGDSLIKQSFQNFEWIIANDGSKDNTDQVVKSIAEKAIQFLDHPPLRLDTRRALSHLMETMGKPGAFERAAKKVLDYLPQ